MGGANGRATGERADMGTQYIFENLSLSVLVTLLVDHGFTFEQQRNMTMTEMYEIVKRISAGEIKSVADVEAEQKARRQTPAKK